uniref:Uncharacterized protein n=1 Tax=Anguilla anguilla TaxID=7936 RepID=A0A0E9QRS1_ANGAN
MDLSGFCEPGERSQPFFFSMNAFFFLCGMLQQNICQYFS